MSTSSLPADLQSQISAQEIQTLSSGPDHVKIVNSTGRRIAFNIRTSKKNVASRPTGVLDPMESVILSMNFEGNEENDRIIVEYTYPPDGAEKVYKCQYFEGPALVRRKNLANRFRNIIGMTATFEK
ncbi:unnamed protein product [Caenorhabditis bovis]|uniref:Major sperm protein n=1 Tax=Caenorhabditis bovis TaxID=2654633 RepID=A0A8S1E7T2_9PELO|nr:unnamed protein product [Caenorhabditis bovis]